jgi:FtsP/CotA-like multicopper oxidase with cupredoxin domain
MLSRREFIKLGAMVGGGVMLPLGMAEKVFGFTLSGLAQALPANPLLLTKFVDQLPIADLLTPYTATNVGGVDTYEVGVYQFKAKVHSQIPDTTVWGYRPQGFDPATAPAQNSYLGNAFLIARGTPTRVTWHNNLDGVSHPMPVDPSLHWADPLKDSPPAGFAYPVHPTTRISTFDYALGKIPIVPHVHGGEQSARVDGGPDAWYTPDFAEIGPTFMEAGLSGDSAYAEAPGLGGNVYPYDNAQLPATIWYHDHALGITRLNVYMGMAGAYVIYDLAREPVGIPSVLSGQTDSFGQPYDVPLVIQDRMFDMAGQLYYPAVSLNPTVNPFWGPEFFGDTILVNGKAWPFLNVEPKAYRFRLLNGSQARFYDLDFVEPATKLIGPAFNVVATDGGYLGTPAVVNPAVGGALVVGTGERIEVVVDFSRWAGKSLLLRNKAKTPYPAGATVNSKTTGQIMQVRVAPSPVAVPGWAPPAGPLNPDLAVFPSITQPVVKVRSLTLNEWMGVGQPLMMTENNTKWPHEHMGMPGMIDPMTVETEYPKLGTTEVWEIINTTADTHPIHLHLVQFQLISRQKYNVAKWNKTYFAAFGGMDPAMMEPMGPPFSYEPDGAGVFRPNPAYAKPGAKPVAPLPAYGRTFSLAAGRLPVTVAAPSVIGGNPDIAPFLSGAVMWAPPEERGWKDTVKMNPGEVTRILVRFSPNDNTADFPFDATAEPGYVWHCHILDHEDNEMMRPYHVIR